MKITFIYKADSGAGNTLLDIGHRILSPKTYPCQLCMITHDHFGKKQEFRAWIENAGYELAFYHRDEFVREHGRELNWPAVLISDGEHELCIEGGQIDALSDFQALQDLIATSIKQNFQQRKE